MLSMPALSRRLPRPVALSILAIGCLAAGAARAEVPVQGMLPTVTLTTTAAALQADDATAAINDGTGIAADAPAPVAARPKPARAANRFRIETIDTASLAVVPATTGRIRPASAMVIEARATTLRPAPLPDQDMDAPGPDAQALEAQQQASVAPSFYGNKDHFSGDGFAAGSNLESDKNNRRRPGGGMSLSIPVQ